MRRFKLKLAAVTVCVSAAIVVASRTTPSNLVSEATRIADTGIWWRDHYGWLPDGGLIGFLDLGSTVNGSKLYDYWKPGRSSASAFERTREPIPPESPGWEWRFIDTSSSPNGNYGLFNQPYQGLREVALVDLKTGKELSILPSWSHWLPDSTALVTLDRYRLPRLGRRTEIYVYPVSSRIPRVIRPVLPKHSPVRGFRGGSMTTQSTRGVARGSFAAHWTAPPPDLLGVTSRGTAVLTTWKLGQVTDVDLFDVTLDEDNPSYRTYTISIGTGYRVDEVKLSRDGKRLVMLMHNSNPPSWVYRWLERFGIRSREGKSARDEIWISDLDGGNRRKLGDVVVMPHAPNPTGEALRHVQWHPNGRQLSFVYGTSLYLTNAE